MNIGEAAQACGLPAKTIRHYEEIGLVSPERTANGYRHFPQAERHKLTFVARARSLGFTIESYQGDDRPEWPIVKDLANEPGTVR